MGKKIMAINLKIDSSLVIQFRLIKVSRIHLRKGLAKFGI
jgi:hypothetical protein